MSKLTINQRKVNGNHNIDHSKGKYGYIKSLKQEIKKLKQENKQLEKQLLEALYNVTAIRAELIEETKKELRVNAFRSKVSLEKAHIRKMLVDSLHRLDVISEEFRKLD